MPCVPWRLATTIWASRRRSCRCFSGRGSCRCGRAASRTSTHSGCSTTLATGTGFAAATPKRSPRSNGNSGLIPRRTALTTLTRSRRCWWLVSPMATSGVTAKRYRWWNCITENHWSSTARAAAMRCTTWHSWGRPTWRRTGLTRACRCSNRRSNCAANCLPILTAKPSTSTACWRGLTKRRASMTRRSRCAKRRWPCTVPIPAHAASLRSSVRMIWPRPMRRAAACRKPWTCMPPRSRRARIPRANTTRTQFRACATPRALCKRWGAMRMPCRSTPACWQRSKRCAQAAICRRKTARRCLRSGWMATSRTRCCWRLQDAPARHSALPNCRRRAPCSNQPHCAVPTRPASCPLRRRSKCANSSGALPRSTTALPMPAARRRASWYSKQTKTA